MGKEVQAMDWEFIVALVAAIPIVLLPAAFVWYLNVGGIYAAFREARRKRSAKKDHTGVVANEPKT